MTHTPGPWYFVYDDYQSDGITQKVINSKGEVICGRAIPSDARLIAAAPELLEALKALTNTARTFRNVPKDEQEWTPIDDEALATALAAITKAEGRG